MKHLKLFFLVLSFYGYVLQAQTRIKVMNYNVMHFPSTLYYDDSVGSFVPRTPVLKYILDTYVPDLLMVCELESSEGADMILAEALQTTDMRYNRGNFAPNQSSSDQSLQQLVFYNSQKMNLISQNIIYTNIRDINHYSFEILTDNVLHLEVFVAHLKSSQGSDNEAKRLEMVLALEQYLETLPSDSYVIFGGDFNLYNSAEPTYQELLDTDNSIAFVDPIDELGYWHNNVDFTAIHTQSPLTYHSQFQSGSGDWDGVTGGLDDRFDFVLASQNLMNDTNLYYVPESYLSYGNNGNCFNNTVASVDCSGDLYSQELRNHLINMSDHLPVVMELETNQTIAIADESIANSLLVLSPNIITDELILQVPEIHLGSELYLYNHLGQLLQINLLSNTTETINVSHLKSGVYVLVLRDNPLSLPVKFIKK